MTRKKVETEKIDETTPKKRVRKTTIKTTTKKEPNVRWDKIEGVTGKVVRHSLDDNEKSIEMSALVSKKKAKRLYYAIDGDLQYFYYELL
jgi:ssDNA-specific exonuclease RecJ